MRTLAARPESGKTITQALRGEQAEDRKNQRGIGGKFCSWCPGAESNHRHGDFQSPALPAELPGPTTNGGWQRPVRTYRSVAVPRRFRRLGGCACGRRRPRPLHIDKFPEAVQRFRTHRPHVFSTPPSTRAEAGRTAPRPLPHRHAGPGHPERRHPGGELKRCRTTAPDSGPAAGRPDLSPGGRRGQEDGGGASVSGKASSSRSTTGTR